MLKKFDKKHFIFFICLFVSIMAFVYFDSANSGAFKYAESYLLNASAVAEKYGNVEKVSLKAPGIKIRESGDSGNANFTVEVTTNNGQVDLKLNMKKTNGYWQISSMEEQ